MRKQSKSILVLAIFMAFIAMAVLLPGMTLTVETAEAVPPEGHKNNESPPAPVPKTGQTEVYSYNDDGDLQKGVAWPDPRFTDHGDGTVTDNLTGLMWTEKANHTDGEVLEFQWKEALIYCIESCNKGGYTNWRLPNVRELHSLIDFSQRSPALTCGRTSCPFDNVQLDKYWSSSTHYSYNDDAWFVDFDRGTIYYTSKYDPLFVWCVRGGQ